MITFEKPRGTSLRTEPADQIRLDSNLNTTGANPGWFRVIIERPDEVEYIDYNVFNTGAGPQGPREDEIERVKSIVSKLDEAGQMPVQDAALWLGRLDDLKEA